MSNLVKILNQDGQLVVTSRQITEDFGKEHKHVLDSIRNLVAENSAVKNMFIESSYKNRGKQYPEYLLTRDGFSLLVMGFTGSKALEWKLKYIEAFNKMEHALKKQKQLSPMEQLKLQYQVLEEHDKELVGIKKKVDSLENNMPLFNVECKELQSVVRKVATKVLGGYKSPAYNDNSLRGRVYADIQYQLRREFGVERYEAIKRCQLETAKKIIEEYIVPFVLEVEIIATNSQLSIDEVAAGKEI